MRLTNTMRKTFVDAVITALPTISGYNKFDAQQKLREYVESIYVADEIVKFSAKYPNLVKREKSIYVDKLNELNRCFSFHVVNEIQSDINDALSKDSRFIMLVDNFAKMKKLTEIEIDNREDLKSRLESVARSCTTTDKLILALPELEHFVPKDAAESKSLPVAINSIAKDLVAAGLKIQKGDQK